MVDRLDVADEAVDRLVLDGLVHHAVVRLDPAGRVAGWYRGAQRLTGYTAPEVLGRSVLFLYGDEASADLAEWELAFAAREGQFATEGWRVRKDGTRFWADVTISPMRDDAGQRFGFVKVLRECTARHEQDLTLAGVEALLDSITEYGVIRLDRAGLIQSWSPGAQRLTGYPSQEVLGRHVSMFQTDEDLAAGVTGRQMTAAASEGRSETRGWRVRKDGRRLWMNVVVSPIRDNAGTITGYVTVARELPGPWE